MLFSFQGEVSDVRFYDDFFFFFEAVVSRNFVWWLVMQFSKIRPRRLLIFRVMNFE